MVYGLIDFAFVILGLTIVKTRGILAISKNKFFKFFCNERVKQNQQISKIIENLLGL